MFRREWNCKHPYKNLGIVTGLPCKCSKIVVLGNKLAAIMILMAVLSQLCWECSYLSITILMQAVLLSNFNSKIVAIVTSAGNHKQACSNLLNYMPKYYFDLPSL